MAEPGTRRPTNDRTNRSAEDGPEAAPDGCPRNRTCGSGIFIVCRHDTTVVTRSNVVHEVTRPRRSSSTDRRLVAGSGVPAATSSSWLAGGQLGRLRDLRGVGVLWPRTVWRGFSRRVGVGIVRIEGPWVFWCGHALSIARKRALSHSVSRPPLILAGGRRGQMPEKMFTLGTGERSSALSACRFLPRSTRRFDVDEMRRPYAT